MIASSTLGRMALATLMTLAMGAPAGAAPREVRPKPPAGVVDLVSSDSNSVPIRLVKGKSLVVDLPRDVKDVLVADPKIANAVMRSARRVYLLGLDVGPTSIVFFDAQGRQIAGFDITVEGTRDLNGIQSALQRVLPDANIKIEGFGEYGILLSGAVATQEEAQLAYDLACSLITVRGGLTTSGTSRSGGGVTTSGSTTTRDSGGCPPSAVVNRITVRSRDQVMLKVTIAEVQRDVIKQLGVDLNGSFSYGTAVLNFNTDNPFSMSGQAISDSAISPQGAINNLTGLPRIGATIRAMERAGVVRTLAEPNLTAISGESATFLAGGEFPIVSSVTCLPGTNQCTPSVEFKKFGVSMNFVPVVLAEGRISLKVLTEVSELSTEGALSQAGFTIPALKTRRAETTVEIPSGGTLAMAGMIQEQTKQAINGMPGLMQVPILGTLFRSRDYINRQTELVILVTPYIVRAVAPKHLSRPDDGFADASDPSTALLSRLSRIYGVDHQPAETPGGWRGTFGFILD